MGSNRPTATIARVKVRREEREVVLYVCSNCQGVLARSDSYCRYCGARLLGVKA
jgi:predicted amidophosphoribosyltransferase